AEIELIAHQMTDAARRQFKAARRHRAAIGRRHLFGDRAIDVIPNPKTFRDRRRQIALRIHVLDQARLAIVDAGLANTIDTDVRRLRLAAEDQRELLGEGNRLDAGELGGEAAHEAGTIVARAAGALAELDRVLRLEVAARQIIRRARERHEGDLALGP